MTDRPDPRPDPARWWHGFTGPSFRGQSPYEMFEHAIMLLLTGLIVLIVVFAAWHLVLSVVALLLTNSFDPTDPAVLRDVFGMFFTVLIALEFKRSFLLVGSTQDSIVRVRSIILIGMLATVRRFIVLDLKEVNVLETFAVGGAILALGIVYWLVRDQDIRIHQARAQRQG